MHYSVLFNTNTSNAHSWLVMTNIWWLMEMNCTLLIMAAMLRQTALKYVYAWVTAY